MCTEKLWYKLIPLLDKDIEPVFLKIPPNKNFADIAAHFHSILDTDKVNLVGFSLGGYVASYFARVYPEQLDRLFVIANSPSCLPAQEVKQRNVVLDYVMHHGYSGMSRKKASNLLDRSNRDRELTEVILDMDRTLGISEFISQYQYTTDRVELRGAFEQFRFPTYFYFSEKDPLVNTLWFEGLTDTNPNLSVRKVSGSGHMLPLEQPLELANYLHAWLDM